MASDHGLNYAAALIRLCGEPSPKAYRQAWDTDSAARICYVVNKHPPDHDPQVGGCRELFAVQHGAPTERYSPTIDDMFAVDWAVEYTLHTEVS